MKEADTVLWQKIRDFELDDPAVSFTFSDRLARENGWSLAFATRAMFEYKRFIFLIASSSEPLTPSDEVDQVWHLHLLYTQSYWEDFCDTILGKKIHHGPTKGGSQERKKFSDWYERTKELYIAFFEQTPPDDLWPSTKHRFSRINFKRVDTQRYWILKKPFH